MVCVPPAEPTGPPVGKGEWSGRRPVTHTNLCGRIAEQMPWAAFFRKKTSTRFKHLRSIQTLTGRSEVTVGEIQTLQTNNRWKRWKRSRMFSKWDLNTGCLMFVWFSETLINFHNIQDNLDPVLRLLEYYLSTCAEVVNGK